VRYRLLRLRHHTVIGSHDQDDDIRNFRAAGAHQRERFVTRRIEERDLAILDFHLVSTDVLGDSALFLFGHARFANGVEQRCLSMIDVAHDRYDGRAGQAVFRDAHFDCIEHHAFFECDEFRFSIEIFGDRFRHFLVQRLIDRSKHTPIHQLFLHVLCQNIEFFREILHGKTLRQGDLPELPLGFRLRLRPDER
jgi:hypothetical protein